MSDIYKCNDGVVALTRSISGCIDRAMRELHITTGDVVQVLEILKFTVIVQSYRQYSEEDEP